MTTIIDNNGNNPVIRTYFNFSNFELALVTTTDLNDDVVTYTSTGALDSVESVFDKQSLTEIFGRQTIPLTEESMKHEHERILESEPFKAFVEKLRHSNRLGNAN